MLKQHRSRILVVLLMLIGTCATLVAQNAEDVQLLKVRETVWRAWFAGDAKTLASLVPPETIVISTGEKEWKSQAAILAGSAAFHAQGGRLIRLEFPRTEIQHFGNVAVTYSQYVYEIEQDGKRSVTSGRVTEIFVLCDGHWKNPGWHTDEEM